MPTPPPGSFAELLALTPTELQPVAERLRSLILAIDPDACEVVRLGERSATYGVGPKKMSEGYVYILPHRKWVNLGFYQGVYLSDPESLLQGTGKKLRHIKVASQADAEQPALADLIRAALAERRQANR